MISVEIARKRILEHFYSLPSESVPLLESRGQVLFQDIHSEFDIPPADNTAMDGYAVRAQDTAGATANSPRNLRVIGHLPAGMVFDGSLAEGEAVRIMTGAPIPRGADAVVPFEETDEQEQGHPSEQAGHVSRDRVRVDVEAERGANLRRAGEDVQNGELALPQGTIIGPAQIGVLASLGLSRASVIRRPRVTILSTGDELLRPGEALVPGKIYDSNAFSIAAQVEDYGGVPRVSEIATDSVDSLMALIEQGLIDSDMLVTSAGVSRGDFDIVKDVLARMGEIGFWTVRMRPGKPLAFGVLNGPEGRPVPHLGLPGNPVSAMMTMELFGRPAIYTMLGKPDAWERPVVRAVAADRITNTDGRRFYARSIVTIEDREGTRSGDRVYVARLTGPQGSGVLTSMALANGYAICPEDQAAIEIGEECDVILVDRDSALPPISAIRN